MIRLVEITCTVEGLSHGFVLSCTEEPRLTVNFYVQWTYSKPLSSNDLTSTVQFVHPKLRIYQTFSRVKGGFPLEMHCYIGGPCHYDNYYHLSGDNVEGNHGPFGSLGGPFKAICIKE